MEHFRLNPFSDIIGDEELDNVVDNYNGLNNPLYFLFRKNGADSCGELRERIISITTEAILKIKAKDKSFISSLKKRLLDRTSYDGPESSLGEIRTYYSLLNIFGGKIKPRMREKNKPTSDFEVCLKKKKIIIEVNTPQPDMTLNKSGNVKWVKLISKESLDLPNGKTLTVNIVSRAPFGRERCENLYENVIHKLTQIKQGDKQSEKNNYSILWVDLFDEYISIISDTGIFSKPLLEKKIAGDPVISTNVLWYSIYGKIGFPIYDSKPEYDRTVATMSHDGKFAFSHLSKWDMVIYASPLNTVVYQNPFSTKKISAYLVKRIKKLPRFNKKMSRIFIFNKHLKRVLKKDYGFIKKIKSKH